MSERRYQPAEHTSWKKMDDLVIVVDLETGAYYSLNKTASAIWENIASGKTLEHIKECLLDKFDTQDVEEATLLTDISGCIEEWTTQGLLIEEPSV